MVWMGARNRGTSQGRRIRGAGLTARAGWGAGEGNEEYAGVDGSFQSQYPVVAPRDGLLVEEATDSAACQAAVECADEVSVTPAVTEKDTPARNLIVFDRSGVSAGNRRVLGDPGKGNRDRPLSGKVLTLPKSRKYFIKWDRITWEK
jgi:hypothetical protein